MVVAMLGMVGCANTGQKSGAYVDDSWITTKVKSELIANDDTKARNISVDTSHGVVTLSGTADDMEEVTNAVEIARGVDGVTSVTNQIRIEKKG
jgi:osmotically-inducible protein OsmY